MSATYDAWSNLANVLLTEGWRQAMAERLEGIRVVVVDDRQREYDVIGTSYDSKANAVRVMVARSGRG